MSNLLEFIEARLTEDEWWARNAGGTPGFTPPASGEHWQWERSDTDEVAYAGPAMGEHLEDGGLVSLRSVETYGDSALPSFIVYESECVNTVGGGHIARHDPARVLREVAAKRELLRYIRGEMADDETDESALWQLQIMAAVWSAHPQYLTEWSPS